MKPLLPPETLTLDRKFSIPEVSIVIPIFNEEESIKQLIVRTIAILADCNLSYEVICIDDGSQDKSSQILSELTQKFNTLKAIILRRNYGQTPAIAAGFKYAKGKIIVTLDGDLQNDPIDIPRLINKLNQGYDLVNGWRKNRQDNIVTRLLPSKIANWVIGKVTGVDLHDYGCSLKAYRSELIADMNLYGELHRFLPALAYIEGAKIAEMSVAHHPRRYGKSKYGLGRTFRVIMDLLTVFFIKKYLTRPMHVFGLFGLGSTMLGITLGSYLIFLKLVLGQSIGHRPLLILAVLLVLTGVQLLSFGLLAELVMRTYHESQKRPIYRVREIIGSHQE
ncbi:glycosyltransferase family 2 protein [cyanobacterium endosymbiont of Epithemia turgida]|uniref:glycosyltransferase family 2 protein n=1 Tax=cyanobacterium endosymbiont of Epithemia turgida TaxID=718217 RepID=UPI0004D1540A|nr:glycosyltransferase family 2 protein [cyanobacterium endosymbiont of Epithemia turgida]BAP18225.1 glycosyl transferase family protein [cyanobacterium endosymbiont of Epithemia turgida isolate EtSB Lake Yunoko]